MARFTEHESLAAVLVQQRTLLHQYRFLHTQLRVLVEAGETRFYGRAIDEIVEIESRMDTVESARRRIVSTVARAHRMDPSAGLDRLVEYAPDRLRVLYECLGRDIDAVLGAINEERRRTRDLIHSAARPRRHG